MKKYIVTTTINPPTDALIKFINMSEWNIIIVGDTKTPHDLYQKLISKQKEMDLNNREIIYLTPEYQEQKWKKLSDMIGWKSIQRRNFGFLEAYERGCDVIATVDDDNIPLENWGKNIYVGEEINSMLMSTNSESDFFDPIFATGENTHLWHRGFPVQLLNKRKREIIGDKKVNVKLNSSLWNGDPDIDSICRITHMPEVEFKFKHPFTTNELTPFNSQNTFLSREIIPYYMMLPFCGRLDDIFGAYVLQQIYREEKKDLGLIFSEATVYQQRNEHDLIVDLEKEIIGYKYSKDFSTKNYTEILPKESLLAFEEYNKLYI